MKKINWLFGLALCLVVIQVSPVFAGTCASASVDVDWEQVICPSTDNERVCGKRASFLINITADCGLGVYNSSGGGLPPIYTQGVGSSGGSTPGSTSGQSSGGSMPAGSPALISPEDCFVPPTPCTSDCCLN